jgi:hypothetical protein
VTLLAAQLAPAEQAYLLEARQMQALSFAVHIRLAPAAACWSRAAGRWRTPAR